MTILEAEHRNRRLVDALRAGRLAEATPLLESYARDRPHRPAEQFRLASILTDLCRFSEATDWLRRVVVLSPGHDAAQLMLGLNLLKTSDPNRAELPLRQAAALRPGQAGALAALGALLARQERWKDAEPVLALACAAQRNAKHIRFDWGLALFNTNRLDEAAACLTDVMRLDPNWTPPRILYARLLRRNGQLSDAEEHLKRAAAQDPALSDIWHLWGKIDFERHLLAPSCGHFWRALALRPDDGDVHYFLGRALHAQERHTLAAAAYFRATELRPDWPQANLSHGITLADSERIAIAAVSIRKAASLRPDWALPRSHLATALLDLNQDEEAIGHYGAAAVLDPGTYGHHLTRAPLTQAMTGDICSLETYATSRGLEKLELPQGEHGEPSTFSCMAASLRDAAVLGDRPLIVAEDKLLVGGVGYNPNFVREQIFEFNRAWLAGGRKRYILSRSATNVRRGEYLFLGAYKNFGHWLINNLCRLRYATHHAWLAKLPIVVPDSITDRQREWLLLAGYDGDRIVTIPADTVVQFERLWVPATLLQLPRFDGDCGLAAGAARFLSGLAARSSREFKPMKPRRLYLIRGATARRRPVNEPEIMAELQEFGFQAIDPATMSAREQIVLIRSADMVVGPMGASTYIMPLARPGTHMVELRVPGASFDVFPTLCAVNGMTYEAINCQRTYTDRNLLFDDFVVPVSELRHRLRGHMGKTMR